MCVAEAEAEEARGNAGHATIGQSSFAVTDSSSLPWCAPVLSIQLSVDPDIVRHPERSTTADHAVRQRFKHFLPDFLLPFGRLTSVRSVVQLYPGP